jgi:hypothetical protein
VARVIVARHGDASSVARMAEAVAGANPGYRLSAGVWDGEAEVVPEHGGVRYLWVLDGAGAVLLPAGYRTQEGDGGRLPIEYQADALPDAGVTHLAALARAVDAGEADPLVRDPLSALCARRGPGGYRGDVAGDLWRLLESGLAPSQWLAGVDARRALVWLFRHGGEIGWSTKTATSWEGLRSGDQVVCTAARPVRLRDRFRYWSLEDTAATTPPCGAVRRLTWRPTLADRRRVEAALLPDAAPAPLPPGAPVDAPNRVNSHVLHVEAAQSRTHFHPGAVVGGGRPQSELYFALDPAAYDLRAPADAAPRLFSFPDVDDWRQYEVTACVTGVAVFLLPDTGHRAVDLFANIVTIPGFKPGNEIYADALIRASGNGAPYNAAAIAPGGRNP